jgi:spermine oxidase
LLAWIGGKGAIEMEKLTYKEIADECIKLIRKFMKNSNLPNPSKFFCSRWNSNELVRGAYSFTSKNTDKIRDWEKVLSKPIIFELPGKSRNTIFLAGEACHEFYFSTVHGAFLSGMEQAEEILNGHNKNDFKNVSYISKL